MQAKADISAPNTTVESEGTTHALSRDAERSDKEKTSVEHEP